MKIINVYYYLLFDNNNNNTMINNKNKNQVFFGLHFYLVNMLVYVVVVNTVIRSTRKFNRHGHGNTHPSYWAFGYGTILEFYKSVETAVFKQYALEHANCCGFHGGSLPSMIQSHENQQQEDNIENKQQMNNNTKTNNNTSKTKQKQQHKHDNRHLFNDDNVEIHEEDAEYDIISVPNTSDDEAQQ
eukprot:UN03116